MADQHSNWYFLQACDMQPGSPKSFRFRQRFLDNWHTALEQLRGFGDADLLLVGGDLTRDGSIHDFELEEARRDLASLPYPSHVIPGNMDVGNKHAAVHGAAFNNDPEFNTTSALLQRFQRVFGEFPWSFVHKNVRFSGFYEAVAGSGLPEEARMWQWLEEELPALPRARHHVMLTHYPLFLKQLDEPAWDLTKKEEYFHWYFSIDPPYRHRIFEAFKKAGVSLVFSGHIHSRAAEQEVEGIRFLRCAAIVSSQAPHLVEKPDTRLGFYRVEVSEAGLEPHFVPLERESDSEAGYGPGGHPSAHKRDYSLAWEKGGEPVLR